MTKECQRNGGRLDSFEFRVDCNKKKTIEIHHLVRRTLTKKNECLYN